MIEEIVFHEGMQSVKHLSSGALKRLAPKSLRRRRLNIFAIWNIEQFIDFQSHDAVICLIDTIDRLRECSFHNVCDTPHKGDFVFWS